MDTTFSSYGTPCSISGAWYPSVPTRPTLRPPQLYREMPATTHMAIVVVVYL